MVASATFLLAGLSVLAVAFPSVAASDPLSSYRWTSRLLVMIAPDETNESAARQRAIFEKARGANRERDLVLIEAVGTGEQAAAIRRLFKVGEREFAAILVGKDGGEKLRSSDPLESERLFETIDAMPMRREEMRRQP